MSPRPWLVLVLAAQLAGCASRPPAPVAVRVPVPVPCIDSVPERPVFPADQITGDEDLWAIGTALWADREARQAHLIRLEAVLRGCLPPPQP